ncbi:MAG: hypothetical protein ABI045_06965 [Flavobacteriales bacterium]
MLISTLKSFLDKQILIYEEIIIWMTVCPNGFTRPYMVYISLVGLDYSRYNFHLGTDQRGTRLNNI